MSIGMDTGDERRIKYTIAQLKDLASRATGVVNWYPYREVSGGTVRGPFNRWFILQPGDSQGNPGVIAEDPYSDVEYAAAAMNSLPHLIERIEALEASLRYAVNSLETANELLDPEEEDVEEMGEWIKETREKFGLNKT